MFLVGLISWWYGKGWHRYIRSLRDHLSRTADFFSVGILLKTLFAPYRQISAGKVSGPLSTVMTALVDKLISRMIGAMIRSFVLIFGIIFITVQMLISLILVIFWGLIPVLPIIGLVLMTIGWTPLWQ